MNRIQMISQELETRRLKLQMGLDPAVHIDAETVRAMWRQLNLERIRSLAAEQSDGHEFSPLNPRHPQAAQRRVSRF